MNKGLVSVVLPIYNVEQYLNKSIKSVVNQSYTNLEIILVDDGSTDSSPEICEKWKSKDSRIKVIHKKNAGLGYARNTGIENSTGEYICFFDSDDFIDSDTIKSAYESASENGADIVLFGYRSVDNKGNIMQEFLPTPSRNIFEGASVQDYFLPNLIAPNLKTGENFHILMSMCTGLFSTELILSTGWRNESERKIISEDVYSLLKLYKYVNKVAVIPKDFYNYRVNENSLTHVFRPDRYEKIKVFHQACINVCDQNRYSEEVKERLGYSFFSNVIAALKMIIKSDTTQKIKQQGFLKIVKDPYLHRVLEGQEITHENIGRKTLANLIKWRKYKLCYVLLKVKSKDIKRSMKKL